MSDPTHRVSLRVLERTLFYVLLAAAIGVTLFQRAFPSQDGPLHLYYIDVLGNLLRGTGAYSNYFAIKHMVPPYAFHPYVVLALNMVFDPLVSEKILVAAYIAWFSISFRYLVHSIDPGNDWMPLLAFPLGLNRTLFLGFYNFSFAVATAIFVAGYWIRHYDELTPKRTITFVALTVLLASMHPIPLMLALIFVGLHTALVFIMRAWTIGLRPAVVRAIRPAAHVAWGLAPAMWIAEYTVARRVGLGQPNLWRMLTFAGSTTLAPFRPLGYKVPLAVLSLCILAAVEVRFFRGRWWKPGDMAVLLMSAACVLMYIFAPAEINYNAHVPDRFPIFGILFAAAFAAGLQLSRRAQIAAAVGIATVAAFLIGWQAMAKQQILNNLRAVYDAPPAPPNTRVALVADEPIGSYGFYPNNFSPYVWAGAHYLRKSRAVFLNSAWLRSPVMLLRPRINAACRYADPQPMLACLESSGGKGAAGGAPPDVLVAVEREDSGASRLAEALHMKPARDTDWLHIYTRN